MHATHIHEGVPHYGSTGLSWRSINLYAIPSFSMGRSCAQQPAGSARPCAPVCQMIVKRESILFRIGIYFAIFLVFCFFLCIYSALSAEVHAAYSIAGHKVPGFKSYRWSAHLPTTRVAQGNGIDCSVALPRGISVSHGPQPIAASYLSDRRRRSIFAATSFLQRQRPQPIWRPPKSVLCTAFIRNQQRHSATPSLTHNMALQPTSPKTGEGRLARCASAAPPAPPPVFPAGSSWPVASLCPRKYARRRCRNTFLRSMPTN